MDLGASISSLYVFEKGFFKETKHVQIQIRLTVVTLRQQIGLISQNIKFLLVFRRQDLCEVKHDVGVCAEILSQKFCFEGKMNWS